jgi:hypothetical protein
MNRKGQSVDGKGRWADGERQTVLQKVLEKMGHLLEQVGGSRNMLTPNDPE